MPPGSWVDALNGYITDNEPWALAKDPAKRDELETVLATAVHGLGTLAVLLAPVLPRAAQRLWSSVGGQGEVGEQPIREADAWTGARRPSARSRRRCSRASSRELAAP